MLIINGKEYLIKTPAENTQDMLTRINTYCSDNNITNSRGELIHLEERFSSPIYLVLWATGYLVTIIQNLIASLGRSYSIQSSEDEQLLNIASIAGLKRGAPSLTTFDVTVRAMQTTDTNYDASSHEGNLYITSEDTITYNGIVYKPALHPDITIAPGEYGYITMVAQQEGGYQITEGAIQKFDSTIPNLAVFMQNTSVPGQDQESIADLRERVQKRQYSGTAVDSAIDAIRALAGITVANIVYNVSTTATHQIGAQGLSLPPRYAMIFVQGYNANIAKAYFKYLTAPTVKFTTDPDTGAPILDYGTIPRNRILETQIYTTHAQQQIPVMILKPYMKVLYVQVFIGMPVVSEVEESMKAKVAEYVIRNATIGQSITSVMILASLTEYNSYGIMGATVSADGSRYDYKTSQAEDVLWTLSPQNIKIVMPEAA